MGNIIKHEYGNGITIVMEDYCWSDSNVEHHEFVTYLEKDGVCWQDISLVRMNGDKAEALIWSDSDSEDYTHKFEIDVHKE